MTPTRIILDLSTPWSFFVTTTGDIYVDNGGSSTGRVDIFALNSTIGIPTLFTSHKCFDIFVDIDKTLYCSIDTLQQVITISLKGTSNVTIIVAGNGTIGSASNQFNSPNGIFVDLNFNLYVADSFNNRIQLFQSGQLNGTTVEENTSLNYTITLNHPTGVILDDDGYLFIADFWNNRIVGLGPYDFRCIVGCSTPSQSSSPATLSFDSYGNIFVADFGNDRIQKFLFLAGSCGKNKEEFLR
jgi:hypothetical protein